MKRFALLTALLFGVIPSLVAQLNWGIKGGLNYNTNGDVIYTTTSIIDNDLVKSEGDYGYHLGLFITTKGVAYFRPELVFTQTKSKYASELLKISKLDIPLLVGFKIAGPLRFFVGPSLQYILDTDLDSFSLSDVKNEITVGLNAGLAIKLKKIGLDIRYEKGFSSNEAKLLSLDTIGVIDTRPEQIILSLSIFI